MATPVAAVVARFRTKIEEVEIDASLTETHEASSEITSHPVEQGSAISDHSRPLPESVTLDCLITNTPFVGSGTRIVEGAGGVKVTSATQEDAPRGAGQRGRDSYLRLLKLKDDGALLTLITSLRTYDSMAIESISAPRSTETFDAVRFSVKLKRIRIVTNRQTRVVTAKAKNAQPKKKTGNQTTKPTTPEKSESELRKLGRTVVNSFQKLAL